MPSVKGIALSGFNSCREILTKVIVVRNGKCILGEMDTSKTLSSGTRRKVLFQFIKVSKGHIPFFPVALAQNKSVRNIHSEVVNVLLLFFDSRRKQECQ